MLKRLLLPLAKVLFATALIVILIRSDRLDFGLILKVLKKGYVYPTAILFLFIQASLTSLRWKKILEIKAQKKLSFYSTLRLTWIGLFFSSLLPGAVTGDLVKLVYAKDLSSNFTKTFLVTSALLDRIFGLISLLILLGIFSIFNMSYILTLGAAGKSLMTFNALLFLGSLLFIWSISRPKFFKKIANRYLQNLPIIGPKILHFLNDIWSIGECKKTMSFSLLVGCLSQFVNILTFWLLTSPFYTQELSLGMLFTFIPLGLITIAIPISPAGIGLGHMAFQTLFQLVKINDGASFFNIYFIVGLTFNLLGVIPYLLSKKRHSLDETKNFEE